MSRDRIEWVSYWQAGVRNADFANRVAHDSQPTGVSEAKADQLIVAVPITDSVLAKRARQIWWSSRLLN